MRILCMKKLSNLRCFTRFCGSSHFQVPLHHPGILIRIYVIVLSLAGDPESISFVKLNGPIVRLTNLKQHTGDLEALRYLDARLKERVSDSLRNVFRLHDEITEFAVINQLSYNGQASNLCRIGTGFGHLCDQTCIDAGVTHHCSVPGFSPLAQKGPAVLDRDRL